MEVNNGQVPFPRSMQPLGNVETWLSQVESRMKESILTQVRPRCNLQTICIFGESMLPVVASSNSTKSNFPALKRNSGM